jgi:alanine dehydrogenase
MKIALIKEGKLPVDKRVVLTPKQCETFNQHHPNIEIVVESSPHRCFTDNDYLLYGVNVVEDISDCDIFLGVKEVPLNSLIGKRTYFFFSHTIKKQSYNRKLLVRMIELKIKMIDYEVLKNNFGTRLLGFGRYAGVVGCYNGFLAYGIRTKRYSLKSAHLCNDRRELEAQLNDVNLPNIKIVISGNGRVGNGALEIINTLGIKEVSKDDFKNKQFHEPVFVNIDFSDYNVRIDGSKFLVNDFFSNPKLFKSSFMQYASCADIFIAGHYYATDSPYLFTKEDAKSPKFKIRTIADISCDIDGPIASTIRSSTILDPIYGYNVFTESEDHFHNEDVITVMAVDNLPCELPKDSSEDFGSQMLKNIFPLFLNDDRDKTIDKATICNNGDLTPDFEYLRNYIKES